MLVTRRDRHRIYPDELEVILLKKMLGCYRFTYNHCLEYAEEAHEKGLPYPGYYGKEGFAAIVTRLKHTPEYSFLKEADSTALQSAAKNADKAYRNMFAKRADKPRFKNKRDKCQTYETMNNNNSIRYVDHNYIQLPKVGKVKFKGQIRKHERILSAVIELSPTGKWYVSLCVEVDLDKRLDKKKRSHGDKEAGIDLGIKSYATTYDGLNFTYVENPKALEHDLKTLGKEQRKLSKMREHETEVMKALGIHSRNYEKQRIRVARVHDRIKNKRHDFLHKLSRTLSVENQTLIVETLEVKRMLSQSDTTRLNRSISDASWGMFLNMLEYKCQETGCNLIKVEKDYPSTKLCSYCGYINKDVTLSMRTITCPRCKNTYDRDGNAARNLYNRRWLNVENSWAAQPSSVDGGAVNRLGRICLWGNAL